MLWEIKDVVFDSQTTRETSWKLSGKVTLFGIPYIFPMWIVVNVHYPKTLVTEALTGAPIDSKTVVALGGSFKVEYPEGFAREGAHTVDVMAYAGPETQVSAGPVTSVSAPIPPIPAVASRRGLSLVVSGQPAVTPGGGGETGASGVLTFRADPSNGGNPHVVENEQWRILKTGDTVTVESRPNYGYQLDYWDVNGKLVSRSDPALILIPTAQSVATAHYRGQSLTLGPATVTPPGGGSVTAAPAGPYKYGQVVTYKAVPSTGYSFVQWDYYDGLAHHNYVENPVTITLGNQPGQSMQAQFYQVMATPAPWSVQASPPNGGTATGTLTPDGSRIQFNAVPAFGWTFLRWTLNGQIASYSPNPNFGAPTQYDGQQNWVAYFTQL